MASSIERKNPNMNEEEEDDSGPTLDCNLIPVILCVWNSLISIHKYSRKHFKPSSRNPNMIIDSLPTSRNPNMIINSHSLPTLPFDSLFKVQYTSKVSGGADIVTTGFERKDGTISDNGNQFLSSSTEPNDMVVECGLERKGYRKGVKKVRYKDLVGKGVKGGKRKSRSVRGASGKRRPTGQNTNKGGSIAASKQNPTNVISGSSSVCYGCHSEESDICRNNLRMWEQLNSNMGGKILSVVMALGVVDGAKKNKGVVNIESLEERGNLGREFRKELNLVSK